MTDILDLRVLLVEDDPESLEMLKRDLPDCFNANGVGVIFYPSGDFNEAIELSSDPLFQFDMIISDTYEGEVKKGEARVLEILNKYRSQKRFCPLVIYSSASRPETLKLDIFTKWADKSKSGDIEQAIEDILLTGIPQIGRKLRSELDYSAGSFLWGFLKDNWSTLDSDSTISPSNVERIIRQRASIKIHKTNPEKEKEEAIDKHDACERYIYPSLNIDGFQLGDIITKKDKSDMRVILTPHCYLVKYPDGAGGMKPKTDSVLTLKLIPADAILGDDLDKARKLDPPQQEKKLRNWSHSPSKTNSKPEGRHWYFPKFLAIPHSFCDFLQSECLNYSKLEEEYIVLASLSSPYSEALQACYLSFFGSVGLPNLNHLSIGNLLQPQE